MDPDAAFRPTVEDERVEDAFLTEAPNRMKYHSTDIPWLIGITTGEGAGKVKGEVVDDLRERDDKLIGTLQMSHP